jgi:hypothetical protein
LFYLSLLFTNSFSSLGGGREVVSGVKRSTRTPSLLLLLLLHSSTRV